jgi:alpha-glucosidase (family GH31 glycosyl hydrolase)
VREATQALRIIHQPRGIDHPYDQEPVERFPRDPLGGEPVVLGLATEPAGAADLVWVTWSVEQGTDELVQGQRVEGTENHDIWQAVLPPFCRGERVTYRACAQQGEGHVRTEAFSFVVRGWQPVIRVKDVSVRSESLVLDLECSGGGLQPQMRFSLPEPGRLQIELAGSGVPHDAPRQGRALAGNPVTVEVDNGERVIARWGEIRLVIDRYPFGMQVLHAGGSPLLTSDAALAFLVREPGHALEVRQTFVCPEDEAFWGFGERFNSLDQRGNTLDVRVYEEYKNQGKRTYIPMPFFVSSRRYGLYLDTARYVAYDLASSDKGCWSFRAELDQAGALCCDLFLGEPKAIISAFVKRTGRPVLPAAWVFGPWMSANDWNSQATVEEMVRQSARHEIPASALVIEAWSDEATFYIWNDAQYEARAAGEALTYSGFTFPPEGRWPDPKGMIDELHRQGIRVVLWQIPVLKKLHEAHPQHELDETYMVEQGFCVKESDGEPYRVRPFWFHDGLVLDFTNPQAVDWWMSKRRYLLTELGVDGFKTDGGEHLFGTDLRFADGRRGDELWNLYPNLYAGAYHQFARVLGYETVTFSRAGFTGAQAFPCHWAGDENSTWEAFRASITAGLGAGISGLSFWGWDIGGFSGEIPTAELYLRSAAMAAFCPIMQYHSEYNARRQPCRDRTPWNIQARTGDLRVIPTYRKYANLRLNLLPYIYSEAKTGVERGLPLMRALFVEHPDDECWREFAHQYYFGDQLLVAPVVEPGVDTTRVYVPPGSWYDFWTGQLVSGGKVIELPAPLDHIPVLAKAGAIIPLNLGPDLRLGSWVGNAPDRFRHLCFKVFPRADSDTVWVNHLSGQEYPLQVHYHRRALGVCVPGLAHHATLILVGDDPIRVLIGDEEIPRIEDFSTWREQPTSGWFYRSDPGEALLLLTASNEPRDVQLLFAD